MLYILITTLALAVPLQRPHITLAIGLVESGCNQYAVGKAAEKGAYQVIEKYWGPVPKSHNGQALQNERIMDELLQACDGDIGLALEFYNGGESNKATKRYRRMVVSKALELALLGQ